MPDTEQIPRETLAFQADAAGFDHLAEHWDADFAQTAVGLWLRQRTHALLDARFGPGNHVIELGCGTGEDTRHMVERGVAVTAVDYSPAMLDAARIKLGGSPLAEFAVLDLGALPPDDLAGPFDGAFSNFGPLNCLGDWQPLAAWLAARLRPGAIAALCVMGPVCLWEVGWHALHLEFGTAFRRLRGPSVFQVEGGEEIRVSYPSAGRLTRAFAPWFRPVALHGIGVFLPPTELYGVLDGQPRLLRHLMGLEARLAHCCPFTVLGDHYWLEVERLSDEAA